MIFRIAALLVPFLAAGCTAETENEKLRKVLVPGYQTQSMVLYSRSITESCKSIAQWSLQVSDRIEEKQPFKDGYWYVHLGDKSDPYKAYFLPQRVSSAPYESAFIFCTNNSTPIANHCQIIGIARRGCFETSYGWYKLSEIDSFVDAIIQSSPDWGSTGGT
jgi:hypothetical protein